MVDTEKYATTFAMLDRDGDGRVSAPEFKELMGTWEWPSPTKPRPRPLR